MIAPSIVLQPLSQTAVTAWPCANEVGANAGYRDRVTR